MSPQAESEDLLPVSQYFSSELEAYVRSVLEVRIKIGSGFATAVLLCTHIAIYFDTDYPRINIQDTKRERWSHQCEASEFANQARERQAKRLRTT